MVANGSFTNLTVDANTGIGWVLPCYDPTTITQIGIRQGSVTGTGATFKVGLQGIGTDGKPDGTFLGGGSEVSTTFTPTAGNDSTVQWHTLDNSHVTTDRSPICIVIIPDSGVDASNKCSFTRQMGAADAGNQGFPYSLTLSSGTWSLQDDYPCVGYRDATTTYGFIPEGADVVDLDDNNTPDEAGIAFTHVSGLGASYGIVGVNIVMGYGGNTGTTLQVQLYNDTTALADFTHTGVITSHSSQQRQHYILSDATLDALEFGTEYIIAVHSDSTSLGVDLRYLDFESAADVNAVNIFTRGDISQHYVSRTDAGAWSPTTTRVPLMSPILREMAPIAGGGGGGGGPAPFHVVGNPRTRRGARRIHG